MPYRTTDDLPPRVRDHLPSHAQEIFLEAYNSAYQEYADPHKRRASVFAGGNRKPHRLGGGEADVRQDRRSLDSARLSWRHSGPPAGSGAIIHHVSIPARQPQHVAAVLAELMGGTSHPFGPLEGAFIATIGDDHGTMIEVYPEHTTLDIPPTDDQVIFSRRGAARSWPFHLLLSVPLEQDEIERIGAREGWHAKTFGHSLEEGREPFFFTSSNSGQEQGDDRGRLTSDGAGLPGLHAEPAAAGDERSPKSLRLMRATHKMKTV